MEVREYWKYVCTVMARKLTCESYMVQNAVIMAIIGSPVLKLSLPLRR